MALIIFGIIFAHIMAFMCGAEVWITIKSFKNNRPISFAFNFSSALVMFLITVTIVKTIFLLA